MNAYELADQLDNVQYQNGIKPFQMYSNMLRKQEYLKLALYDSIAILEAQNKQQADRIAELEKNLHVLQRHYDQLDHDLPNAEPYGWIGERLMGRQYINGEKYNLPLGTPLYTTPQTKPLSDEEIIEIGNSVVNLIDSNEGWVEFARAIEAKVRGEK